jgi:hypothetical protein
MDWTGYMLVDALFIMDVYCFRSVYESLLPINKVYKC